MLEPALVLESSLTVEAALAELGRYPNFTQVVVRFELAGREATWFAMPSAKLRRLLQDAAEGETLDVALELGVTPPSPVRRVDAPHDGQHFAGVVLDGDQVVAVETAEPAAGESRGGVAPVESAPPPHRPSPPASRGQRAKAPPPPSRGGAEPPPPPPPVPRNGGSQSNQIIVPVLFATDRKASGDAAPGKFFGAERGPLTFGVAEVSIPAQHERGELEAPTWWKFEFQFDPQKHVTLMSVQVSERAAFVARARDVVGMAPNRDVLVFVHGYNVSFQDAARRTAQIAHDLPFSGAPMLYSWPSTAGTLRYTEDETNARWTVSHFNEFLQMVRSELDATAVHVIAHSMGNRVLTEALRVHRVPGAAAALRQVVLAAPDIDAGTFTDLAREFHAQAERVTLYASSKDLALKTSKMVHGYPRAGDAQSPLVIAEGVDTIDASLVEADLLGHSYVGEAGAVLADVRALLQSGKPPGERNLKLQPRDQDGQRYWAFQE